MVQFTWSTPVLCGFVLLPVPGALPSTVQLDLLAPRETADSRDVGDPQAGDGTWLAYVAVKLRIFSVLGDGAESEVLLVSPGVSARSCWYRTAVLVRTGLK